ncbi:MAG: vitamin K epoxide reductase family protein [Saprospiraceae bacterium]|nr:vitamin K epoxide reductase family protein [Saprospiraceae bacterium]
MRTANRHLFKRIYQLFGIPYSIDQIPPIQDLFDVSDLFIRNDIRSMVVEMPISYSTPIPLPAITQHRNGDFAIIEQLDEAGLKLYLVQKKKRIDISYEAYQEQYIDKVLLLELIEEREIYNLNLKNFRHSFVELFFKSSASLIIIALLFILYLFHNSPALISIALLDLMCLILAFSSFLAQFKMQNNVYSRFCQKEESGQSICIENGVLSKWIPIRFSTLSVIYFFTGFLFILLTGDRYYLMYEWWLWLGIPVIIISLYKQLFEYKKACILCMWLIGFYLVKLILYFGLVGFYLNSYAIPEAIEFVIVIVNMAWILGLDRFLTLNKELKDAQFRNNSIWSKKESIEKHMEKRERIIPFSNDESGTSIVLISHLECKHCENALNELVRLQLLNPTNQLDVYISYPSSEQNDAMMKTVLTCFENGNLLKVLQVYNDWKRGKVTHYADGEFHEKVEERLLSNRQFFQSSRIDQFPLIVINNSVVPNYIEAYQVKMAFAK